MTSYPILLNLHSWIRWGIVILAIVCLFTAVAGWRANRAWTDRDRKLQVSLTGLVDLQFLVGIVLWFVSPLTPGSGEAFKATMKVSALRFFTMEHVVLMVLAIATLHIAGAKSKRGVTNAAKFKPWAIGLIIATLLVLVAIPWPFLPYGRPLFRF